MNNCDQIEAPKSSPLVERVKRIVEELCRLDEMIDRLRQKSEPIRCPMSTVGANPKKDEQSGGCQIEEILISFEVRICSARDCIKQIVDEFQI